MGDERADKALVILSAEIKTPPLSHDARREIGFMIRKLQQGLKLEMPHSTPKRVNDLAKRLLREYDAD